MDLNRFNPEGDFHFYKEKAPPGFHFVATTTEMVLYLLLKEQGHPLANIFQEVPLNDYNPDELQRKFNKGKGDELYLYMKIKPLKNGSRVERKAGSGRWKNIKSEKITQDDRTITKTTLIYYVDGKKENTCWMMHEYRLHRKKSERHMRDDVVFCKIYKGGGAGKTGEAIDEENKEETGGSIGSCDYLESSTTVSNGIGQSFPDVHSLEYFETEDLVTPTKGSSDLPMATLNDPFQSAESPIEDSGTPVNIVYADFPIADVDDPCQFARLPPIECLATLMNGSGDFSMADVDDPFQHAPLLPIEHLATHMNDWGDFTMADANEYTIQFLGSPIEDF